MDKKVFITHAEVSTSAGADLQSLWENILNQRSGICLYDDFLPNRKAAIGRFSESGSFEYLLLKCIKKIVDESKKEPKDIVLFIGSSVGGMQNTEKKLKSGCSYNDIDPNFHTIGTIKNFILPHYKFKKTYAFSTACTSSANALGFAYECIKKGIYSDILVVGADAISLTTVNGFDALGVLSPSTCKPFCAKSFGMNVSEGIGALLISDTKTRNCTEFLGVGYSSDAYHMAHPKPNGEGAKIAMQNALSLAKVSQLDYINAHGTGTKANDSAEAAAVSSLFDFSTHISSTKNITGHTLGAAGVIEAIITCKAILEDTVPPNCPIEEPLEYNCKIAQNPIKKVVRYAMSNSLAFGGNNVSLVFGKSV
ncbi:MAG: beta-ketoacyl-[acyl-carrier-protein] synthase family protein [Campylobacteraceae bacterium]|jgi:3-oxoacyl-[acyl-carrier-protein] synthase-1|nr:beta-ketoacyl-[acyl-carrier-protein] synthase family protein [Campylobacteraceae bacterium]